MRAPPLAAVLHEDCRGRRCDYCFTVRDDNGDEKPALRCARCKVAHYCGRACQQADWRRDHRIECGARKALEEALATRGLPGPDAVNDALLAARCVRRSHAVTAIADTAISGKLCELETLTGRLGGTEQEQLEQIARVVAAVPRLLPEGVGGEEAIFDALCRFRNNNFAIVNDLFIPIGAGCFPNGAALNHSCMPNCVLTYELHAGREPLQVLRAMEIIAGGDELTHSYVDLALPTWERQSQLREGYGFDCACNLCAGDGRAALDAAQAAGLEGGGVGVCAGTSCPLPPAPPLAERDEALALADQLANAAALELDAEAELRQLEEVCLLRERWLDRRHLELMAAHAAAHTTAMAAGDWAAAERHCGCLVEYYTEVYPEWHPVFGLQIFTLGQLKELRGAFGEARDCYDRARKVLRLTHGCEHSFVKDLGERLRLNGGKDDAQGEPAMAVKA